MRLDPEGELSRAQELAMRLSEAVEVVRDQTRRDGLQHAILDRLAALLQARARHRQAALQSALRDEP